MHGNKRTKSEDPNFHLKLHKNEPGVQNYSKGAGTLWPKKSRTKTLEELSQSDRS